MAKEDIKKMIANISPELMGKVETILKEAPEGALSQNAQAAYKAAVKILTPFQKEGSDAVLAQVLKAAGFNFAQAEEPGDKGQPLEGEAGVEKAHHEIAMKAAECAYGEELKKLGYEKYPVQQPAMKAAKSKAESEDEDEEEEELAEKTNKESQMADKVTKESDIDLSKVAPEVKPHLEAIFKEHKELVQKNADLEQKLKDVQREGKKKEFIAKASAYSHYVGDRNELANQLLELSESNPALLVNIEKQLDAQEAQAAKNKDLFREVGSGSQGTMGTSWEAIEKAAEGYVAKSGEKISKAEATDRFLQTSEGQAMYAQHQKERGGI